jgi:hypothetical protein
MDQLFPLGHVSGSTKILALSFQPDTFASDLSDVRLGKPSGASAAGFRLLLERQVEHKHVPTQVSA